MTLLNTLQKFEFMGMFDTIFCKYPLPMPEDPKGYSGSGDFQTKDLDNVLSVYEIREDGSLWREKVEGKYIAGDPKSKNLWDSFGHFEITKKWWEKQSITDTINILDYQRTDGDFDYCIEYEIILKDGIVSSVNIIRFSAEDNSRRKEADQKFAKEMKASYSYKKTFRYRFFFGPYNSFVSFAFRKINKILNFLLDKSWKVEKFLKF